MISHLALKKGIAVAEERGAIREREAVVRWLRQRAKAIRDRGGPLVHGIDCDLTASDIERGEHLK